MPSKKAVLFAIAILLGALPCMAQARKASSATAANPSANPSQDQAQLLKTTEAYVRNLFAWGPDYQVKLGSPAQSAAKDFYAVPLEVTRNGETESGDIYVSKDGKTLLRGEIYDMNADPYAETRSKLHIDGNPSEGPADARVTLVEFADFECPHCRALDPSVKEIVNKYPVRLVYKDFPIAQLHPWATTAAIGARCAFEQQPGAFWRIHDDLFANQDEITPDNVWNKLGEFASQAGLDTTKLKACMASPEAAKAVEANREEGLALKVNSTPTVFVNGRPMVSGNPQTLEDLVEFELAAHPK